MVIFIIALNIWKSNPKPGEITPKKWEIMMLFCGRMPGCLFIFLT